jgi:hypothetical protein
VPRWLWPPPGASDRRFLLSEALRPGSPPLYGTPDGEVPEMLHLRALTWLLDEHPRAAPTEGEASETLIVLSVARTLLPGGRVGHAYALDDGPLGQPGQDRARGILWRWVRHALGQAGTT